MQTDPWDGYISTTEYLKEVILGLDHFIFVGAVNPEVEEKICLNQRIQVSKIMCQQQKYSIVYIPL